MKEKYLKKIYRYNVTDHSYHVVIDLDTYRDVYSEWDYSPMNNRDLDEDLLEFLMDCSEEIGIKRNMIIDFYIPEEISNSEREAKSIAGFRHYFSYRIRRVKGERWRMLKSTGLFFAVGVVFLILANVLESYIANEVLSNIIVEGLYIGAWVVLWEIFYTIFFEANRLTFKIRHYKRLQNIQINYKEK